MAEQTADSLTDYSNHMSSFFMLKKREIMGVGSVYRVDSCQSEKSATKCYANLARALADLLLTRVSGV